MCVICVDLIKQKMTIKEANSAAKEMFWSTKGDDLEHFMHLGLATEHDGDLAALYNILKKGSNE